MISVSIQQVKTVQKKYKSEIASFQATALKRLRKIAGITATEQTYLNEVIGYFSVPNFLLKEPGDLEKLKTSALPVPTETVKNKKTGKDETKICGIRDKILTALQYTERRSSFFPKYFHAIGIKACVYCNSQLTVTLEQKGLNFSGRFDVDHLIAKDQFPFLAISLFNLYPTCAPCNRAKSNDPVDFKLYSNDITLISTPVFTFRIDPGMKAKYLADRKMDNIYFTFEPDSLALSLQDKFHIKEIYDTQMDVVEELLIKSQIYNEAFKNQLRSSFNKLSLPSKLFERVIVGNYTEAKDIHKRPMSKFMQDIARDLKLISKLP